MTAAGLRGVVNDTVAIYFRDAALAAAFVARWCRQAYLNWPAGRS